jgi:hypothetical protein
LIREFFGIEEMSTVSWSKQMDANPLSPWLEAFKRRVANAIRKAYTFLQTPFGATAGGGLIVLVIAKLLFG